MCEQKLAECWRFDERPQRSFDGTLCFVHLEQKLVRVVECRHTGMHYGFPLANQRMANLRFRREPHIAHAAGGSYDYPMVGAERFAKVFGEITAEMNLCVDGGTVQFLEGIAVKL